MADLTNRNADETVPDIATWGTGNVLETGEGTVKVDLDDKASLSGANFTDMPQVDGIPIVERGSNSDGEFVRFADGTQIISMLRTDLSTIGGTGRINRVDFPLAFISTERTVVVTPKYPSNPDGSSDELTILHWSESTEFRSVSDQLESVQLHVRNTSGNAFTSSNLPDLAVTATGRWK